MKCEVLSVVCCALWLRGRENLFEERKASDEEERFVLCAERLVCMETSIHDPLMLQTFLRGEPFRGIDLPEIERARERDERDQRIGRATAVEPLERESDKHEELQTRESEGNTTTTLSYSKTSTQASRPGACDLVCLCVRAYVVECDAGTVRVCMHARRVYLQPAGCAAQESIGIAGLLTTSMRRT